MNEKQTTHFKRENGVPVPLYPDHYKNIWDSIKEGEVFQLTFAPPKKEKSTKQLGYLFSGIYPFLFDELTKLGHDDIYIAGVGRIKLTIESLDKYLKKLFSAYIQKDFDKGSASMKLLAEYVTFIDQWSMSTIGYPIPDAKKGGVNHAATV